MSRKTVKDVILKLDSETTEHFTQHLSSCQFSSIFIDESTDITSSARLEFFLSIL